MSSQAAPLGQSRLSTVGNYREGPGALGQNRAALLEAARVASQYLPEGYTAEAYSGQRDAKDQGPHRYASAIDFRIRDPSGKEVPNYQDPSTYRMYEGFHQDIHASLMQTHPDLAAQHRWGGYFSGPPGHRGAMDEMHSDLAGSAMAAGGWKTGKTATAGYWGRAQSRPIGPLGTNQDRGARGIATPATPQGLPGGTYNWPGFEDERDAFKPMDRGAMDRALQHKVTGTGKISVDVNAPKGTNVRASGGGLFKKTEVKRQTQMDTAAKRAEPATMGADQ
jgi:hypothetical protein